MRFFFYGTLAQPGINRVSGLIHRHLQPIGPARMRGALYAIGQNRGWYPALVRGDAEVVGQLFAAAPGFDDTLLARVDAYEDFDPRAPDRSLYVRELCPVAAAGEELERPAMVYRYNRPLPPRALPIPGGDFLAWLDETGNRAFS